MQLCLMYGKDRSPVKEALSAQDDYDKGVDGIDEEEDEETDEEEVEDEDE